LLSTAIGCGDGLGAVQSVRLFADDTDGSVVAQISLVLADEAGCAAPGVGGEASFNGVSAPLRRLDCKLEAEVGGLEAQETGDANIDISSGFDTARVTSKGLFFKHSLVAPIGLDTIHVGDVLRFSIDPPQTLMAAAVLGTATFIDRGGVIDIADDVIVLTMPKPSEPQEISLRVGFSFRHDDCTLDGLGDAECLSSLVNVNRTFPITYAQPE